MNVTELRAMVPDELINKLLDLKQEYFNLRFQHGVGQLENTSSLSRIRRDISRVKTVIREIDLKQPLKK